MKKYEILVADIIHEEIVLRDKINKLETFMMTEDYQKINERQKLLLTQQLAAMNNYKGCLISRVLQLRFEHEQNKDKACESEPEEEERLEPHIFSAMEYEAHRQKKDSQEHKCETCKHNHGPHTCSKLGKDIVGAPGDLSCWEAK